MKILVTGCNGQLGRELRRVFDRDFPGQAIYTDVAELDLTDAGALRRRVMDEEVTHVVNCAAYTAVDKAEEEVAACTAVNVAAVENVAAAADAVGAKVVHVSTDYVFDGTNHRPYRESDRVNPLSVYGATKRKGETALLALAPESIILRTAWLYSPYGSNFVKAILKKADAEGDKGAPLRVVADQIGTPTYARDLAEAIATILGAKQWVPGIYHFTDEGVASWYDFAVAILRLSGRRARVTPVTTEDYPTVAARPAYSLLDKTRIKATYSLEIPHWEEALTRCLGEMGELKESRK